MTIVSRLLLVVFLMLAAASMAQAQAEITQAPSQAQINQTPGQAIPATKDQVQIYTPPQSQIIGRVSIPDEKAAVLIQPEGRVWRVFRTTTLRTVAGVSILGMFVLLALFYLIRGTIHIEGGRSGRRVLRFGSLDRFAHWMTAISFLVLALTGLIVTFGRPLLIPLVGLNAFAMVAENAKLAHNFFSAPLVLGIVLILVLWVRDNIPEKDDITWLRSFGGLFSKKSKPPEAGRFNAGQKGIFWGVVLGGGALAATGFMMLTPFAFTGILGMQIVHVIHGVLAALMIALIIAHIYIGSLGMEGAFEAMGSGEVDENWIKDHHHRWYKEQHAAKRAKSGSGFGQRPAE